MTLGSLFDGIGGFPLSAAMCGIEPRWASEIEPFPILVTHKRFPNMKHLGSVTDINGAEVEPVDIITFGSPCQDLSVAGKQAGIHEGARSNLFFEAVRIIKEMRQKDESTGRSDVDVRPRYAVWENVPGAFSSNGGKDFQAVLQALAEVADPDVSIPLPDGGKWLKAGCIVGEGYSIAWRTLDAQYFPRTPQRRKRIYLIADFGSERAGEVLFEPESLRGDSSQGGTPWQRASSDAQGCADGGSSGVAYSLQGNAIDRNVHQNGRGWAEGSSHTLNTTDRHGVVALDCRNLNGSDVSTTLQAKSGGGHSLNYQNPVVYGVDSLSSNSMKSANPHSGFHEMGIAKCLDTSDGNASKNQGGMCVVYDCWGNGEGEIAPTVTGDHQNRVTDYTGIAVHGFDMQAIGKYSDCGTSSTLKQRDYKDATDLVVEKGRRYIVRRLIPLECCRLQGYPDGWTENLAVPDPTIEEVEFFTKVWADWAEINGTKPKSLNQVIKWLADPQSDSAEYKAYGNSLAIPCSYDVLRRIANNGKNDSDRDTGR
jgi:DNA (cytosine-5)-methyltransferase 1